MVAISMRSSGRLPALVADPEGLGAVVELRQRIKVLLVADMGLLCAALVSLLSEVADLNVAGAVRSTDVDVVGQIVRIRPDVVVVDVDQPRSLGLITELRARMPQCPIVALAAAQPAGLVRHVLVAGVRGAVHKNAPVRELLEAIRRTSKGETVVDTTLAIAALTVKPNPLTPREMDVLRLVADGATGREIAGQLFLSPGTVRNYLSKAITKVEARNRADAVRIAREAGWI